jgi:hypothetical protein
MSQNHYRCPNHIKDLMRCHTSLHFPKRPRFCPGRNQVKDIKKPPYFYANQVDIKSRCSSDATEVHNKRLGINYSIQINVFKNYTKSIGHPPHQKIFNTNNNVPSHPKFRFFKEYKNLRFDVVRSKQQVERWNRLTRWVQGTETTNRYNESHILTIPDSGLRKNTSIKVLQHVPLRSLPQDNYRSKANDLTKKLKKKLKNYRRSLKRKKQLPPLPAGTKGDARAYYRDFHNINLFDPNIRKLYHCHHLPKFKQRHAWYKELTDMKQALQPRVIVDLINPYPNSHIDISTSDREFLSQPDVFLRRTPPIDDDDSSTVKGEPSTPATQDPSTQTPPPTPHED